MILVYAGPSLSQLDLAKCFSGNSNVLFKAPVEAGDIWNHLATLNNINDILTKKATATSAEGDRNRNYKLFNINQEYNEEKLILDTYLLQFYKTSNENRFLIATSLRTMKRNILIEPKDIQSAYKIFRLDYAKPLILFSAAYITSILLKVFSNKMLASNFSDYFYTWNAEHKIF